MKRRDIGHEPVRQYIFNGQSPVQDFRGFYLFRFLHTKIHLRIPSASYRIREGKIHKKVNRTEIIFLSKVVYEWSWLLEIWDD